MTLEGHEVDHCYDEITHTELHEFVEMFQCDLIRSCDALADHFFATRHPNLRRSE